MALRLDVLSTRASVALAIAVPALLSGPAFVFRVTREPLWLFAASIVGATVSVACHRQFVRLHRKAS